MKECEICGEKFETGKQLGGHLVSHKNETVECQICKKIIEKRFYKYHLTCHKKDSKCLECGKIVRRKKFCNHSCCAKFNNKGKRRHGNPVNPNKKCFNCGCDVLKSSNKFCSVNCVNEYEYKQNVNKWLRGEIKGQDDGKNNTVKSFVRKWLIDRSKNKCEICGWSETNKFTGNIPLSVHHKDGNSENTVPENIELICPNCHSLTATYGALNKGKGRNKRRNAPVA